MEEEQRERVAIPLDGALTGLRVVDASTLFAGPMAAMHLGDMGADVIKVEHPTRPDPRARTAPSKDGVRTCGGRRSGATSARSPSTCTPPGGREALLALRRETADVVIENFRPGTLERWGLGYDELSARNPRLVLARVTGFGQTGPYRSRPGFGTLAEAMSGFAAMTGEPDGPPTLPPFGLADGVASLATAFAIMTSLSTRERTGRGQDVDTAIVEPILAMLGPQITRWDQLARCSRARATGPANNAPRNTYRTSDGPGWRCRRARSRSPSA